MNKPSQPRQDAIQYKTYKILRSIHNRLGDMEQLHKSRNRILWVWCAVFPLTSIILVGLVVLGASINFN